MNKWHLFANGIYIGTISETLAQIAQHVTILKVYELGHAVDVAPMQGKPGKRDLIVKA